MTDEATVIRNNSYGAVFNQRSWVDEDLGIWVEVEYAGAGDIMIYTPDREPCYIKRTNLVGLTEILLNLTNQVTRESRDK